MNDVNGTEQRSKTAGFFFARFIAEQAGESSTGILARTAAWLSDIQAVGDVCLDLAQHAEQPWPDQFGYTPVLNEWRDSLLAHDSVGEPGVRAPMTLDRDRLYLNRFWHYEDSVAGSILGRLETPVTVDKERLSSGLCRLFKQSDKQAVDWQQLAAALTVYRRFAVISGGPGTGKTTSLVKVLVLLLEQQPDMRISMAAPTGKAAARMMESIRGAKQKVDTDAATRAAIPDQAATIHRLLGYSPKGYRHDRNNPLMLDCLVIDEASMLDLPMMARLLQALPESARLILLGDRDQLASVDAGNVLGDITGHGHEIAYAPAMVNELAALTGSDSQSIPVNPAAPEIAHAIALLRTSYRFDAESGIGRLARAINSGDGNETLAILAKAGRNDVNRGELSWQPDTTLDALLKEVVDDYNSYLQAADVESAMDLFEKLRVLCAVRQGPTGVESINQTIARQLLGCAQLMPGDAVHGMPVMVTTNNYELGLFNGDIGLLWHNGEGVLRGWFRQADNSLREIPVQSLPQYEPAWAMTVHKSQGSEFDRVVLILPETGKGDAVLTRELVYTAVTRARHQFTLHGSAASIKQGVTQVVSRSTGLSDRLGWPKG